MKWQMKRYGRIPNAEKRENVAWLVKYSQRLWFKLQLINLSHVLFAVNAIFQNSLHRLNRNRHWRISLTLRSAFQLSRFFPARTKNSWWRHWRVIDRKRLVLNKGSGSLKKINLYYRFDSGNLHTFHFFGWVLTMVTDLISSGSSVLPWPTSISIRLAAGLSHFSSVSRKVTACANFRH